MVSQRLGTVALLVSISGSGISRYGSSASIPYSLVYAHVNLAQFSVHLADSLASALNQLAQLHARRQHHNSRVHLHRVLALYHLAKRRVALGIVVHEHNLLILITTPRTAEQLSVYLQGISAQRHFRASHRSLYQRVVFRTNRERQLSAPEGIHKVHLHLLTGRQRKLLHLPTHDFTHRDAQRKIITSYNLFHISINYVRLF